MKTIQVIQLSTGRNRQIKVRQLKTEWLQGTILELLVGAYLAYLFLQFFIN